MIADALAEDRIDRLDACIQACEGVPSQRLKPGRMADAEAVIAELLEQIGQMAKAFPKDEALQAAIEDGRSFLGRTGGSNV